MRILFATAELSPVATVGGLAAASAGIVAELRRQSVEVDVVLPDYGGVPLDGEATTVLDLPGWAAPAAARTGVHHAAGPLTLVSAPGLARPDPYTDEHGEAWPDNDRRFLAFAAAVATLARDRSPDVLHLNDWHTATALAALDGGPPALLSIHNLAYQGWTGAEWVDLIGDRGDAYRHGDTCNPLAGAIRLADAVVVVSPTFREEILRPGRGFELDDLLADRREAIIGIRNGIDTSTWDPRGDPHLPTAFDAADLAPKAEARSAALAAMGLTGSSGPLAVVISRLAEQKGIDLLLPALPGLIERGARVAVLGSGSAPLASQLRAAAASHPGGIAFTEGYDDALSHVLTGGGDLLLMPSRFEPCGLTQMQAMSYGTLPVATDVGGLHDTIVDLDLDPARGTGWLAAEPTQAAVAEALDRALLGWADEEVRMAAQRRGMTADWSWHEPAARHVELYEAIAIR
jgi:starch synthase